MASTSITDSPKIISSLFLIPKALALYAVDWIDRGGRKRDRLTFARTQAGTQWYLNGDLLCTVPPAIATAGRWSAMLRDAIRDYAPRFHNWILAETVFHHREEVLPPGGIVYVPTGEQRDCVLGGQAYLDIDGGLKIASEPQVLDSPRPLYERSLAHEPKRYPKPQATTSREVPALLALFTGIATTCWYLGGRGLEASLPWLR